MTRIGFFLFNTLLVGFIYLLVYLGGAKTATISYVLRGFSEPYIILILVMMVLTTIRWFMNHDPEIGREIVTWVNALWYVPAITIGALYLIGGIHGGFGVSLHSLLTVR